MSRRSRRNRVRTLQKALETNQRQVVQGPQVLGQNPATAAIQLAVDLTEKYLGRGLMGTGPYLEVLDNRSVNELICKHGYKLFRDMGTDPEVDASLDGLVIAATSQPMSVSSPITEDTNPDYIRAQEYADFASYNIERLPIDEWRKEQLRGALQFGHAVSEIDWEVMDHGPYQDRFLIENLRLQRPEDYGFVVDRWGKVYGVTPLGTAMGYFYTLGNFIQLNELHNDLIEGVVPRYKLSVWTWEKSGVDPRGTSVLVPAYIPWWGKQRALEEWSCWIGRFSQPSIWATPGPNAVPTCDPRNPSVTIQPTELLLQALIQFKSASVLALPFGSEVNLLEATGSVDTFIKMIELFDKQITRAILGQHLATSEGSNQSRSAAELHALVLRLLIASIRTFMARMIQQEIIKPLIQANFGFVPDRLLPIVNLGDSDGFPPSVTEIAVLMQSGYFSEDQLPKLDKLLGLPIRMSNKRIGASNLPPYEDPNAPVTETDPENETTPSPDTEANK